MAAPLRHCPQCQLVFEGGDICPACRHDIKDPAKPKRTQERRKTSEVPRVPKKR
jgi:hypothetical protein